MPAIKRSILQRLITDSGEPQMLARVDQSEWPVVLTNPAFEAFADRSELLHMPVVDLVESVHGTDIARELSSAIRAGRETTIPLEARGRNWLLAAKPINDSGKAAARYYALFWRDGATMTAGGDASATHEALLRARRKLRDLARDDSLTGLLNATAFQEVLLHDWAVAAREQRSLALLAFRINDFGAYVKIFGRHAADCCLRRVAHTVKRCLRRASDVATRLQAGDDDIFVVLCQAQDLQALDGFSQAIARQVRELGLHHPHSRKERFVTVCTHSEIRPAKGGADEVQQFIDAVVSGARG